jgi:hypothetical protein
MRLQSAQLVLVMRQACGVHGWSAASPSLDRVPTTDAWR